MKNLVTIVFMLFSGVELACLSAADYQKLGISKVLSEPKIDTEQTVCGNSFKAEGERLCVDIADFQAALKAKIDEANKKIESALNGKEVLDIVTKINEAAGISSADSITAQQFEDSLNKCKSWTQTTIIGSQCVFASEKATSVSTVQGDKIILKINETTISGQISACFEFFNAVCKMGGSTSSSTDKCTKLNKSVECVSKTDSNCDSELQKTMTDDFNVTEIEKIVPTKEKIEEVKVKALKVKEAVDKDKKNANLNDKDTKEVLGMTVSALAVTQKSQKEKTNFENRTEADKETVKANTEVKKEKAKLTEEVKKIESNTTLTDAEKTKQKEELAKKNAEAQKKLIEESATKKLEFEKKNSEQKIELAKKQSEENIQNLEKKAKATATTDGVDVNKEIEKIKEKLEKDKQEAFTKLEKEAQKITDTATNEIVKSQKDLPVKLTAEQEQKLKDELKAKKETVVKDAENKGQQQIDKQKIENEKKIGESQILKDKAQTTGTGTPQQKPTTTPATGGQQTGTQQKPATNPTTGGQQTGTQQKPATNPTTDTQQKPTTRRLQGSKLAIQFQASPDGENIAVYSEKSSLMSGDILFTVCWLISLAVMM